MLLPRQVALAVAVRLLRKHNQHARQFPDVVGPIMPALTELPPQLAPLDNIGTAHPALLLPLLQVIHLPLALKPVAHGIVQPVTAKCRQLLVALPAHQGGIGMVHRVLVPALPLPVVALVLRDNIGTAQLALQLPQLIVLPDSIGTEVAVNLLLLPLLPLHLPQLLPHLPLTQQLCVLKVVGHGPVAPAKWQKAYLTKKLILVTSRKILTHY